MRHRPIMQCFLPARLDISGHSHSRGVGGHLDRSVSMQERVSPQSLPRSYDSTPERSRERWFSLDGQSRAKKQPQLAHGRRRPIPRGFAPSRNASQQKTSRTLEPTFWYTVEKWGWNDKLKVFSVRAGEGVACGEKSLPASASIYSDLTSNVIA